MKLVKLPEEDEPSEGAMFFLGVAVGVSVPLMILAFG